MTFEQWAELDDAVCQVAEEFDVDDDTPTDDAGTTKKAVYERLYNAVMAIKPTNLDRE